MCARLRALQCGHANARFAISVGPPRDRGKNMGDIKATNLELRGQLTVSERSPAHSTTASRSGSEACSCLG